MDDSANMKRIDKSSIEVMREIIALRDYALDFQCTGSETTAEQIVQQLNNLAHEFESLKSALASLIDEKENDGENVYGMEDDNGIKYG